MSKQHTISDAHGLAKVLVYEGPNKIIKAGISAPGAMKHLKFPLVSLGSIKVTPVTNFPYEF